PGAYRAGWTRRVRSTLDRTGIRASTVSTTADATVNGFHSAATSTARSSARRRRADSSARSSGCTQCRRRGRAMDGEVTALVNANGMEVRFVERGGTIVSLRVPDRRGRLADVTPGYDTPDEYASDTRFFGALIGRYANR